MRAVIYARYSSQNQREGGVPRSLTPYLDRYLEHHRPRLLQERISSRLWINQYGEQLSLNSISGRLLKVTTRLGYPMRAHDFRRSAATTIAELRPDLARIIGHFLGILSVLMAGTSPFLARRSRITCRSRVRCPVA